MSGALIGSVLSGIVLAMFMFGARDCHLSEKCAQSCRFHDGVLGRVEVDACVCKDGSSWTWQEGYTGRVGAK